MKKIWLNILIVILSLFICALFAGCGKVGGDIPNGSDDSTNVEDGDTDTTIEESEGLTFELIYYDLEYEVSGIGTCTDTKIVIPATYNNKPVTRIGTSAFENCKSITDVVIPNSVTSIGENSFLSCYALKNIEIPDSVTSIETKAFSGCKSLINIEIPKSVTSIDGKAFRFCERLTTITVNSENERYCDIDGVVFNKDKSVLEFYPFGRKQIAYTIPSGVTNISDGVFYDFVNLKRIEIPDSVTTFGENAFIGCSGLERVDYNGTIDQWVEINFSYFSNPLRYAKHLYINNQEVTQANLTSATIIKRNAFYGCSGLTSVIIPISVKTIDYGAFTLSGLTSVYYKGTIEDKAKISIDSEYATLTDTTWYYYSETQPTDSTEKYWHYVDGVVTVW